MDCLLTALAQRSGTCAWPKNRQRQATSQMQVPRMAEVSASVLLHGTGTRTSMAFGIKDLSAPLQRLLCNGFQPLAQQLWAVWSRKVNLPIDLVLSHATCARRGYGQTVRSSSHLPYTFLPARCCIPWPKLRCLRAQTQHWLLSLGSCRCCSHLTGLPSSPAPGPPKRRSRTAGCRRRRETMWRQPPLRRRSGAARATVKARFMSRILPRQTVTPPPAVCAHMCMRCRHRCCRCCCPPLLSVLGRRHSLLHPAR